MITKRNVLVVAFALFSLFFGAGNLILPPQLGFKGGDTWGLLTLGFALSAVCVPILGIWAHAKLQGTIYDFAKKVSPVFSLVYAYLVYAISISLPSPRTASVTHEMGVAPFFEVPSLLTSGVYFLLVFVFVMNRSKILDVIGKLLTPAILLILVAIIAQAIFGFEFAFENAAFESPFTKGILEGYQTFDAIGAVVVGGVIIISINLKNDQIPYEAKKRLIIKAGLFSGLGLLLVYAGLLLTGALMQGQFDTDISRTALLSGISLKTLGPTANIFLSVLVSLACFTTAVGIITGTADFVKGQFDNSGGAYLITAIVGCILGVAMGQFDVGYIIAVALPALMFIYPITIVLVLLNVLPEKLATARVFRWVVATTILFSIPDFLATIPAFAPKEGLFHWIPLSQFHMGWVLPAFLVFWAVNVIWNKRSD